MIDKNIVIDQIIHKNANVLDAVGDTYKMNTLEHMMVTVGKWAISLT